MILILCLGIFGIASANNASNKDAQGYKNQYCTDPRTMRKHAAYTEWADAYSCSRHRCQPGGRNLAIYTVGCKRVEAPESAIECEEVVEDTNMQFPFCCTRLRCLVVVRGEVWTRVLGQPWEVLPAAPWSHMYKMKKPPPTDTNFTPKTNDVGPVYELTEPEAEAEKHGKNSHSARKSGTDSASTPDCNDPVSRAAPLPAPAPDIVIALSTNNDKDLNGKTPEDVIRHKRGRKASDTSHYLEKEEEHRENEQEIDENVTDKQKHSSEEKMPGMNPMFALKDEQIKKPPGPWDIPQSQWNEQPTQDQEVRPAPRKAMLPGGAEIPLHQQKLALALHYTPPQKQDSKQSEYSVQESEKVEKKEEQIESIVPKTIPNKNLQALVDAIGTRMKDIESVVQRMSEKVHDSKTASGDASVEKKVEEYNKDHKVEKEAKPKYLYQDRERELASTDEERFKPRYTPRFHDAGKYHTASPIQPHHEDTSYFSDPSNAVRRALEPKEPPPNHATYMAPVENYRKPSAHVIPVQVESAEDDKKKKKHHKKRKGKPRIHKKRHEKRKHLNKLSSNEYDKNGVSLEDSSAVLG